MTFPISPQQHVVDDEWRMCIKTSANMLVSGNRDRLDVFWQTCQSHVRQPITFWCAGAPLHLDRCGTLVLLGVEGLERQDQRALSAWLTVPANGETQVFSLSATSLFGAVEDGTFDRDLFYRLNTIHLRLGNGDPSHVDAPLP